MQEKNYFTLPYNPIFDNNSIEFSYKISGSHQFSCEDTLENIFLRGQRFFRFSMNTSRYGSSIHGIKIIADLANPIIGEVNHWRQFHFVFRPFSKSFISIRLKQIRCKTGDRKTLPTGVSLLSEKRKICLRDPVQEPLKNSMLLELSIQGQHKISNCLLGQLEIRTHLCLIISKLPQSYYGVPYWSRFKTNFREDRLIWTSNLTTQLVSQSGGYVLIFLPGKMTEAMLHSLGNQCCQNGSCYLKYRWRHYDTGDMFYIALKRRHESYRRIYRMSRSKGNHTWAEANRLCQTKGYNLPSFVSLQDTQHFFTFLDKYYQSLGTPIFIGIHKMVIILFSFEPCTYIRTRLHSSRMRTARLLPVSPSMHCTGWGLSAPGRSACLWSEHACLWSGGGGACLWSQGVSLWSGEGVPASSPWRGGCLPLVPGVGCIPTCNGADTPL